MVVTEGLGSLHSGLDMSNIRTTGIKKNIVCQSQVQGLTLMAAVEEQKRNTVKCSVHAYLLDT